MPLSSSLDLSDNPDARHVLRFTADDVAQALDATRASLAASTAEVCNLSISTVGRLVEGVLRVRRLDEAGAVRLADRLAERPGVRSTRVEHLWGLS
ncbi:MAG: hypothetical protein Q8L23_16190 [Caulobacter sp.]|nr:hypothetical protein [Caulobacter sp.]